MIYLKVKEILKRLPSNIKQEFEINFVQDFRNPNIRIVQDAEDAFVFVAKSTIVNYKFLLCSAYANGTRLSFKYMTFNNDVCIGLKELMIGEEEQ